jgi:hypothetical protein
MRSIFTFCLAAALNSALAQPGTVESLPMGTRANLVAQTAKEVDVIELNLTTPSHPYQNAPENTHTIAYSPEMGSLEEVIRVNMVPLFNELVQPGDVGGEGVFGLTLKTQLPSGSYLNVAGWYFPRGFTISWSNGAPVIPFPDLLLWTVWEGKVWVEHVPVTGAAVGVQNVEYLWKHPDGEIAMRYMTTNGTALDCPGYYSGLYGNGVLYLNVKRVNPDALALLNLNGEVILHYGGGAYAAFDMKTGMKIRSTVVRLEMCASNNAPCIAITGWHGKQVTVETSTDMISWTPGGTVTLDSQGKGLLLLSSHSALFVRGIIAP